LVLLENSTTQNIATLGKSKTRWENVVQREGLQDTKYEGEGDKLGRDEWRRYVREARTQ